MSTHRSRPTARSPHRRRPTARGAGRDQRLRLRRQQQPEHPRRLRLPCLDPATDACAAAGFSPDFAATSQDYATAQVVAAGLGVSLIPQLGLSARHPGVAVRRVRHPEPVRPIRAGSLEQPFLRTLLDAFRESVRATPEAEGRVAPRSRSSS